MFYQMPRHLKHKQIKLIIKMALNNQWPLCNLPHVQWNTETSGPWGMFLTIQESKDHLREGLGRHRVGERPWGSHSPRTDGYNHPTLQKTWTYMCSLEPAEARPDSCAGSLFNNTWPSGIFDKFSGSTLGDPATLTINATQGRLLLYPRPWQWGELALTHDDTNKRGCGI